MTLARRWPRYSLRTLLIALTIFGVWLGLRVNSARRQAQAVAQIRQRRGGSVQYDFELTADSRANAKSAKSWVPAWIIARTGPDLFHSVLSVRMDHFDGRPQRLVDNDLEAGEPQDRTRVTALRRHLAALPRLRSLELNVGPEASDECLAAVSELSDLERLYCCNVTDAGVAHLASLRRLRILVIFDSKLTDKSLRVFGAMSRLENLVATDSHFTDDGLSHLRNLKRMVVMSLDCGERRFTDAGLVHLEGLQSLENIQLQDSLVTPAGIARLQRAIPALQVVDFSPPPPPGGWRIPVEVDPFGP